MTRHLGGWPMASESIGVRGSCVKLEHEWPRIFRSRQRQTNAREGAICFEMKWFKQTYIQVSHASNIPINLRLGFRCLLIGHVVLLGGSVLVLLVFGNKV